MTNRLFLAITACCAFCYSCKKETIFPVPAFSVYNIQKHNDSLYFSTLSSGIFRFSPDNPKAIMPVARTGRLPIRSIAFSNSGTLYTSSYESGVCYLDKDTLLPLKWAPQPAWSIKFDDSGRVWLAGLRGIFRQYNDSLIKFSPVFGVHDIAFYGNIIAAAHMDGITLFNKETGAKISEYCQGVICWHISAYDSIFIGGGRNLCVIIDNSKIKKFSFGPDKNMLWTTARNSHGAIFLGTQEGLFSISPKSDHVKFEGFKGVCIKSLVIDNQDRLWVGRFSKKNKLNNR